MNSEEEYWKVSLNFRRRNFEKIGSVWELWALPATFRTHFFCSLVTLSSFEGLIPPHARIPNSMWDRKRLLYRVRRIFLGRKFFVWAIP